MRNSLRLEECEALSNGEKNIKFMSPAKSKNGSDTGQQQAKNSHSSPHKASLMQITMSVVANFSALSSGMGLGFPAITLSALTNQADPMSLNTDQASWFASINAIACPFGGLLSAYVLDRFGRKKTLVIINITSIISWTIMALASKTDFDLMYLQLLVARTIIGITTGLTSAPPAVYSAEIASSNLRGRLAMLTSMSIALGILLIYVLGYFIPEDWRIVSVIAGAVSVASLVSLIVLPESPSWLLSKGRQTEAEESLMKLRGVSNKEAIKTEFLEMAQQVSNRNTQHRESAWEMVQQPEVYKPLAIMISFFAFQQFSGIFVVIVYAAKFVKETGISFDPLLCTVLIGFIRIIATVLVGYLLDTAGRKPPTIVSGIGMTICMFGLAAYVKFPVAANLDWLPVLLILSYIFTSTLGFLTIPFTMLAEMFPQKVRGLASGITIFSAYSMSFVCIKLYPKMVELMGTDNVVIFYGIVSFVGIFYAWFVLPETKGKSLLEIEDYFKRNSIKLSSRNHVESEALKV